MLKLEFDGEKIKTTTDEGDVLGDLAWCLLGLGAKMERELPKADYARFLRDVAAMVDGGARNEESLRFRLRVAGMTQKELAEKIGVHRQQVNAWCRGKTRMRRETAEKVAKAIGCTAEEILNNN